jgi:predicted outer membrane repeat protein
MKITLHFNRNFSNKLGGGGIQCHALVARQHYDDVETERTAQTIIHILQEGARENFIKLFLKTDTSCNADNGMPLDNKPATVALKARCQVAEQQARQWKQKYERLKQKFYEGNIQ